jgi:putative ABC transport system permease protein
MNATAIVPRKTIQKQIVLPWSKAIEISLESLKVRFGRSLITSSSIALATAFLCFTLTGHDFLKSMIALNNPDINYILQKQGIDLETGDPGLAARELWLISTSMLVCLVGVANALLMSVTERIKEIGTMKCLGALNSFVVKLFLIEALFLGVLSSAIGGVAGVVFTFLMNSGTYGLSAVLKSPFLKFGFDVGATVLTGTFLSVVAAIYPSLTAANMQPVEAMRKEV